MPLFDVLRDYIRHTDCDHRSKVASNRYYQARQGNINRLITMIIIRLLGWNRSRVHTHTHTETAEISPISMSLTQTGSCAFGIKKGAIDDDFSPRVKPSPLADPSRIITCLVSFESLIHEMNFRPFRLSLSLAV